MKKPEFTTCEQYVLAKMLKLEEENKALKAEKSKFDELLTILMPKVRLTGSAPEALIETRSIWQTYDRAEFDRLVEILGLTVPEIPVNNTEEEN